MEHTKEPWYVGQGIDADLILDADGNLICANCVSAEVARRIVACVNACAGISTEDLEKTPNFKSLMVEQLAGGDMEKFALGTGLVAALGQAMNAKKQRDELLEALISAVEDEPNACFAEYARSVIAKATGETK